MREEKFSSNMGPDTIQKEEMNTRKTLVQK